MGETVNYFLVLEINFPLVFQWYVTLPYLTNTHFGHFWEGQEVDGAAQNLLGRYSSSAG